MTDHEYEHVPGECTTDHEQEHVPDEVMGQSTGEDRHFYARLLLLDESELLVDAQRWNARLDVLVKVELLLIHERSLVDLVHILGFIDQLRIVYGLLRLY